MPAGLLAISSYTPARDRNGRLVSGARMDVFENRTTTRVTVYAEASLTTPLPNPVIANSSGQFPAVWAPGGDGESPILYTLAYSGPSGESIGNPSTFDDIQPSVSLDLVSGETKVDIDGGNLSDQPTFRAAQYLFDPVPEDQGAVGDGSTDDAGALAALLAEAGPGGAARLNPRDYKVSSFDNPMGVRLSGDGLILSDFPGGGEVQLNSYCDEGKPFIGVEYLYRVLTRVKFGGALKAFIYGDSTVATAANGGGFAGTEGEPQNLIPRILKRKGLRVSYDFTNRAVGGTTIASMNAIPDIDTVSGTTDLFIIKYGINDASDGLEDFATTLDAKLAAIRAIPHGKPDQLAIMLIGPNSTFNPPIGHSNIWYESLRGVYENAARKHKCFYFDTYAALRDVSWTFGISVAPYMDSIGVHPAEIMQGQIWGRIMDAAFGYSDLVLYDNNDSVGVAGAGGWTNYTSGSDGFAVASASMDREGWVSLRGLLKDGTMTANTAVCAVPSGYAPQNNEIFTVASSDGPVDVRVTISGNVELQDGVSSNAFLSLSGIRYRTR